LGLCAVFFWAAAREGSGQGPKQPKGLRIQHGDQAAPALGVFPEWAHRMRIWPFDILTPEMSDAAIDEGVATAVANGANVLIFYIEEEHMYGTFVDEEGFSRIEERIRHLTSTATQSELRTLVYLNGLEVMTRGAYDANGNPTGIPTMAGEHPDWLQRDLSGQPIVYHNVDDAWLRPDWEDAWISPYSGYRELFGARIERLADAGVDGVYVDATFLPGYQLDWDDPGWGSADPAFSAAFHDATGFTIPAEADFSSPQFRAFLLFRHRAVSDYLKEIATRAATRGLITFWESSTNDGDESVLLGNETAVTGRIGLAHSPEIEPEGDWLAAFRMAKAARELNGNRPMIYLGWPENRSSAAIEYSIALAQSGNYYPTADIPVPAGAFSFMADIASILDSRVPHATRVAVAYSFRNKDFSHESASFQDAYEEACRFLIERHVPFRIVTLEYLPEDGLQGIDTVILPGLVSLADTEVAALNGKTVVLVGQNIGTRDESWTKRSTPILFDSTAPIDSVASDLGFTVVAPPDVYVEPYDARDGNGVVLFAVSPSGEGSIRLESRPGATLDVAVRARGQATQSYAGSTISIPASDPLLVIQVSEVEPSVIPSK
jgi:hypothetical protein